MASPASLTLARCPARNRPTGRAPFLSLIRGESLLRHSWSQRQWFKPAPCAARASASLASKEQEVPRPIGEGIKSHPAQGSQIGGLKLACPICHTPFEDPAGSEYSLSLASRQRFVCRPCCRTFSSSEGFVDTVIASGAKDYVEPDLGWGGSSIFRNPLVSFVYERGWRQGFSGAGFPGPDEEWAMARSALSSAEGSPVLDLSCGSGLFTRRMAASGLYPLVVAVDFSETMMRQTKDLIQTSPGLQTNRIALVRADVARLPFETGSVAGVHAGAALHCWPSPSLAVAEISRVLRPGGVFAATTFLSPTLPLGDDLVKPLRKAAASRTRSMKRWEPEELEELCRLCGLEDYKSQRKENFIFLTARKSSNA